VIENSRRLSAALVALGLLASLTACNGSSTSVNPFVPSRGTVRVINGSPDVGAIDVAIGKAGQPNFSNVVYAGSSTGSVGISQYIQFNAPTQNIYVYVAGQDSTPISVGMSSITIVPSGRNTLVLTGEKANGTLKLVNFTEHIFKTVSGSASVGFHDASPKAGSVSYSVGYNPASNTSQLTTIGTMTYGSNQPIVQEGINAAIATTGIGFFAQGGGNFLSLTPSQVDPNNTTNVMPFNFNGNSNADQNLSIYMIDGASTAHTPVLVGVFDPDN